MENPKEKIEVLKKFFTVTIAGFDFAAVVMTTLTTTKQSQQADKFRTIYNLHKEAFDILHSEADDYLKIKKVDAILLALEIIASQSIMPPHIEKGGISHAN